KRIANLCYNYIINYDLTRSDFKSIHIEKKLTVQLEEFLIKIKVDRIDELTTGESLIIDYKTGRLLFNPFSLNNYQDLNIDDPQLFIYSLYENNVKAVLLANIRSEKIEFIGLIDSKIKIFNPPQPTTKLLAVEDWQNYLNKIYAKLYKLIHEFKQGVATVKPKHLNNTCRICQLQKFCRIFVKK
ncbi:MAG: PD-(D/E)XK nuclease family protein, partial [Gammaproteobacteria bacterium]